MTLRSQARNGECCVRGCQNKCGLTSTAGSGAGTTRRRGIAVGRVMIRLGSVAIRSVAATTDGNPRGTRQHQGDAAAQATRLKDAVDDACALTVRCHLDVACVDDMRRCCEELERHRQRQRMASADQRNQLVLPQRLHAQIPASYQDRRDGEIEFAGGKLIVEPVTLDRVDLKIESWRIAAQPRHEGGEQ